MNNLQLVRCFSSTAANCGKKTFNKFSLFESRGSKQFKREIKKGKFPNFEHRYSRGVREPHLMKGGQEYIPKLEKAKNSWRSTSYPHHWEVKPNQSEGKVFVTRAMWERQSNEPYEKEFFEEMIPELVVPDLEGFQLKPYVSYKVPDIEQPEFTPQDLFHAVYTAKIINDFKDKKLQEDGSPMEPSPEETLESEEAKNKALQTGSDYI